MIETVLQNFIKSKFTTPELLDVPVLFEVPENIPPAYVVLERTGGYKSNCLNYSTFAIKSYAPTLYGAAILDSIICEIVLQATECPEISSARLNSHYNYTDTSTKEYRYQAVFDIVHY